MNTKILICTFIISLIGNLCAEKNDCIDINLTNESNITVNVNQYYRYSILQNPNTLSNCSIQYYLGRLHKIIQNHNMINSDIESGAYNDIDYFIDNRYAMPEEIQLAISLIGLITIDNMISIANNNEIVNIIKHFKNEYELTYDNSEKLNCIYNEFIKYMKNVFRLS